MSPVAWVVTAMVCWALLLILIVVALWLRGRARETFDELDRHPEEW